MGCQELKAELNTNFRRGQFMPNFLPILFIMFAFFFLSIGCSKNNQNNREQQTPPPPVHGNMCKLIDLGEASDAVEKPLPNNQFATIQGMSNPKTLVWQDKQTGQIFYATKLMGAQGRLFYMAGLETGEKPTIKSVFTGTLLLWKHLEKSLQLSMKKQFHDQWGVDVDVDHTYIMIADKKPEGCE
jgi:hypothetical protein